MKTIVNCETGEVIERELNKAEKDQQKIDEANVAARKKIAEAEAEAQATARQELLNKLGITADEAKLLLG
jgi:vacuolar-type H+-ATPase subunit H